MSGSVVRGFTTGVPFKAFPPQRSAAQSEWTFCVPTSARTEPNVLPVLFLLFVLGGVLQPPPPGFFFMNPHGGLCGNPVGGGWWWVVDPPLGSLIFMPIFFLTCAEGSFPCALPGGPGWTIPLRYRRQDGAWDGFFFPHCGLPLKDHAKA